MGIIIKKRFGPRNFVQQLDLKDVYSIGSKKKKTQQVGFNNPQGYIIPESAENTLTGIAQKSYNTAQNGASKIFANYYGGTGDTRDFVWTAKPRPPVATSLDRLGEDYDRNRGTTIRNLKRARNLAEGLAGQKLAYLRNLIFSSKTRGKVRPMRVWARNARKALEVDRKLDDAADKFR